MKNKLFIIPIMFLSLCFLVSCYPEYYKEDMELAREEAYERGYNNGYAEGRFDYDINYESTEAYANGFHDGAAHASYYIIEEAYKNAGNEDSEWTGEEAVWILDEYFKGNASRSDAKDAAEWLMDYYYTVYSAAIDAEENVDPW